MRALISIETIVREVLEQVRKLGLRDVSLVVMEGDLTDVVHEAAHRHFALCTHDTPLAGAELELVAATGALRLLELEVY